MEASLNNRGKLLGKGNLPACILFTEHDLFQFLITSFPNLCFGAIQDIAKLPLNGKCEL